MVRFLSMRDPGTGELRTRYTYREAEIGEVADSLASRIERYTGNPVERRAFVITTADSVYTAENLIGRTVGTGASPGRMLVTAHFDATASRSPGWEEGWRDMPAPGANDNATGVAALLEAARSIGAGILPFDIEYVLFSAEELGKVGSLEYLEPCDSACADSILGVINLDMIGYRASAAHDGSLMTNYRSGWLADLIFGMRGDAAVVAPVLRLIKPGPSNWDHASFWEHDPPITAVTFAEPLEGSGGILYPYYHTIDDTYDMVDFAQVEKLSAFLVSFIESFADAPAEVALLQSDLMLLLGGNVTGRRVFRPGDEVTVWVRIRNTGGADPPPGAGMRLTVAAENSGGRRRLFDGDFDAPTLLRTREIQLPITIDDGYAGGTIISAGIEPYGMVDEPGNNEVWDGFSVATGETVLLYHGFQPNPVTIDFPDARFCVNLAAAANLIVECYTLEGESIGSASLGESYGTPLNAGFTCFSCGEIFRGVETVAPGVYIYRVKLFMSNGEVNQSTGRFAVLR
jgi:hypothetical protein